VFHFDVKGAKIRIDEIEDQMNSDSFWNDTENSQFILKQLKQLKDKIASYEALCSIYDDIQILIEMGMEEDDADIVEEVKESLTQLTKDYESLRITTLLSGEYDSHNAIISLHAGAGGTESCDWVSMLFRMFNRWSDDKGFKTEVLDVLEGEEAGIKSITAQISGENAYGYLKSEKGVHRLVRISPFDSSGRRHTSFASCDVIPEIDDDVQVEIQEEELRIDTYRASGAGGQHINTTDSAVRITHIPTGIVVQCQNERSQHKNKDRAMKMLKAKLFEYKQQEQMDKLQGLRGEMKDIAWGSQIRSYVMNPYSMVKDHRTNVEVGNVASVMDGKIDIFINAYLTYLMSTKHKEE
jgi:peptide chain release factor 2